METKLSLSLIKGQYKPRLLTPSSSKLPSTITKRRGPQQRPVISGPIGPVKNSRGPDFTRSDTFTIVPGIKDCGSDESLLLPSRDKDKIVAARKAARRISAGFSSHGPLAGSPTVAKSDFNAMTGCRADAVRKSSNPLRQISTTSNVMPKGILTSSSSSILLPHIATQDENTPPAGSGIPPPSTTTSKLPKSRTMSVLQDLKTSMSRPSMSARSTTSRNFGGPSRKTSASSTATNSLPLSSSRLRLPHASMSSLSRSSASATPDPPPATNPQHITAAQPSAYWSGRFVALHDRFASEYLNRSTQEMQSSPISKDPFVKRSTPDRFPPRSSSLHPAYLSHSITTSALTNIPFPNQRKHPHDDEEARCRRVFRHLEALCTTHEARRSLFDFQQAYARQCGRVGLLPDGGSMEDKSLMNKIFGGGQRKTERRSLSTLRESSNSKAVRKALAGNTARGRGKRLSIA